LDNLQLMTWKENCAKGWKENSREVIQYDSNMNKIAEFESISAANKATKESCSVIGESCRGWSINPEKSHWRYKENRDWEYVDPFLRRRIKRAKQRNKS